MSKTALLLLCLSFIVITCYGQIVTECPQNIGFEKSTFANWQCYTGFVGGNRYPQVATGTVSLTESSSVYSRQTLIKRSNATDDYGNFSLNAPNGSEYVVKLGNDQINAEAESISYTINVPANVDTYSVIFNYAVVFENPAHEYDQQPRFTAKVFDVTTNGSTSCGSFQFVAPGAGGGLPGFLISSKQARQNAPVFYKPWSPVLVNLTEYRGHTIRLEFTTNDCTRGGHFGYAYIDFNENCSIPITGNITCPTADSLTLKVLKGFSQYRWFNASTNQDLGTADSVILNPIPAIGTKIGVELIPFDGLGCTQILYTYITGIALQTHDPPPECISVDLTATSVTAGNSSDLTYTYWTNSNATNPVADPKKITVGGTYYIKGRSSSGCTLIEKVTVTIIHLPDVAVTNPSAVTFPTTVDITGTFAPVEGLTYSFWADKDTTVRLPAPTRVRLSGTYYVKAVNYMGCYVITPIQVRVIITDIIIPNTFTPNGDGVNDVFTVLINDQIKIDYFRIYNRWGTPVYQTSDITRYWDGFTKNDMVPVGVYFWILEGEENSKKYRRSGSVTVLR